MKTYRVYNNQIRGFTDVRETVKAIEKIAASSVHTLKKEVANLNVYTTSIEQLLGALFSFYSGHGHPLLKKNHTGSRALVIITGDQGLVGGLWHALIAACMNRIGAYTALIVIGEQGRHYLEEENIQIAKSFYGFTESPKQEHTKDITTYLFDAYKQGAFSKIDILYPQFISLAEQKPAFTPFVPFIVSLHNREDGVSATGIPIFEPNRKILFDQLVQKYIRVFLHAIVLEAKLSELSARTVAMEHATAKTDELIQKLRMSFRKERRRIVTQRQLESFIAHKT